MLRESCKQCRRSWLPELGEPVTPLELVLARPGAPVALLDPQRGMGLDTWARSLELGPGVPGVTRDGGDGPGTRTRPVLLAVGPEGGFDPAEREAFHRKGATSVRVAPHVLRIETAAEAAMAVVGAVWLRWA